jgi:purine-binding chemotaxis protein CheW
VDQTLPPETVLSQQDPAPTGKSPSRICIFTIEDCQYAVDLHHIREVLPITSITPIPGMPPIIIGMTNVRGSVVPIVDLRMLLGLGLPQPGILPPFAVVLRHEEYQLAVLVDGSPEILTVLPEQFEPANSLPGLSEATRSILGGVVRIDEAITSVLDVIRLVAYLESEVIIESV